MDTVVRRPETLGFVTYRRSYRHEGRIYVHVSTGRVADALARKYERVILCAPTQDGPPPETTDPPLAESNIELLPQPFYTSSVQALKHPVGLVRAFWQTCRQADVVFARGLLPLIGLLWLAARRFRRPTCHWIIGNSLQIIRESPRRGSLQDRLAIPYLVQDRLMDRWGRWLAGGAFLCNGQELADIYASPHTQAIVSTVLTDDEFHEREDTCQADPLKLLFLGYVRPEKGLEYLIQALGRLKTHRPWKLIVVGPWDDYPDYKQKIDRLIAEAKIGDRIQWEGYVSYGPALLGHMQRADIFVLPTLSEGTPRTLVEARASSCPIIASNVGGIPTSVQNAHDGLLVPSKDPDALADAIDRVIADGDLRRRLVRNGLATARELTVDRFADRVIASLEELKLAARL
jgi:glycosyltransferase involved in cell wall biosynthesis